MIDKIIAYIKMFATSSEKESVESKEEIKTKESVEQEPVKKDNPKVGDVLWYVSLQNCAVMPCTVTHIQCDGSYRMMTVCFDNHLYLRYSLDDYGKFFFLSQKKAYESLQTKEAFAALKKELKKI